MVIDDEALIRDMMSDFFACFDYEVVTASDGADAIEKFMPGEFDCIISDCAMPRMDGLKLLETVRAMDREVIFFLVTGLPDDRSKRLSVEMGAHALIAKPFDINSVKREIEAAIGSREEHPLRERYRPEPIVGWESK